MTVKEEIFKSKKIGSKLYMTLARVPDTTDPDAPLFDLFVRENNEIKTEHKVSLNKLKEILDRPEVTSVEGSSQLRPATGAKHPGMLPRM